MKVQGLQCWQLPQAKPWMYFISELSGEEAHGHKYTQTVNFLFTSRLLIPSVMDCILLVPRPMQESVVLLNVPSSRLHHPSEEMAWKWFVRAWLTAFEKSSHDVCLRIFKAHIVCSHSKSSEQLLLGWISPTEILKGILRASVRRIKRSLETALVEKTIRQSY